MSDHEPIDLTDEPSPAELDALAALLAEPVVWDEPDPALEARVLAAIAAEAAASGAAGEPAPTAAPIETGAARRRSRGRRRVVRASRPRAAGGSSGLALLVGAAAVAALIAVVAVAALRQAPGGAGYELALSPPPAAQPSGAQGEAHIEERPDGTRILLDVRDLAPAPPGSYYEAWLRKSPEVGVSAGTFHARGGGREQIELWSGVSPQDYPLLTVTIQQESGGAASSGKVVLAGRLG